MCKTRPAPHILNQPANGGSRVVRRALLGELQSCRAHRWGSVGLRRGAPRRRWRHLQDRTRSLRRRLRPLPGARRCGCRRCHERPRSLRPRGAGRWAFAPFTLPMSRGISARRLKNCAGHLRGGRVFAGRGLVYRGSRCGFGNTLGGRCASSWRRWLGAWSGNFARSYHPDRFPYRHDSSTRLANRSICLADRSIRLADRSTCLAYRSTCLADRSICLADRSIYTAV